MLAFAGSTHCEGTPMWLSDALFTSLYASLAPVGRGHTCTKAQQGCKKCQNQAGHAWNIGSKTLTQYKALRLSRIQAL